MKLINRYRHLLLQNHSGPLLGNHESLKILVISKIEIDNIEALDTDTGHQMGTSVKYDIGQIGSVGVFTQCFLATRSSFSFVSRAGAISEYLSNSWV